MNMIRFFLIGAAVLLCALYLTADTAEGLTIQMGDVEGVTEIEMGGGESNVGTITIDGSETSGCVKGSGTKKTDERTIPEFTVLDIDGSFQVHIDLRKKQNIEVTGDDNILPHIVTKVKGDTLFLTLDASICAQHPLEVHIETGDIAKIKSKGSNNVFIANVQNRALSVDLDGSGNIHASGTTGEFVAKVSGSGDIYAKDLHAEDVNISISGVGNADVYASQRLHANIEGVGDIGYFGNPREISKNIEGVGSLEKKD